AVDEQRTVRQTRERIMGDALEELIFVCLALGDVCLGPCGADRTPRPAHDNSATLDPDDLIVAIQHSVFTANVAALLARADEHCAQHRAVIGMRPREPSVDRRREAVVVTEHLLPAEREVKDTGGDIPVPDAVFSSRDSERISLSAATEGAVDDLELSGAGPNVPIEVIRELSQLRFDAPVLFNLSRELSGARAHACFELPPVFSIPIAENT